MFGAIAGLAWWLWGPAPSAPTARAPGVLIARGCRIWRIADDTEDIVYYARRGMCAVAGAALSPKRLAVIVVDGDAEATTGAVRLVIADDGDDVTSTELTRGRPAQPPRAAERASAALAGVDPGGRVAVVVWPDVDAAPIHVLRTSDGALLGHTDGAAGVAITAGRAAILRNRCAAGCGAVYMAEAFAEASAIAESAPPTSSEDRWSGPAAFSPYGLRLAAALSFDGARGGVVIMGPDDSRRVLPLQTRGEGEIDGLAWTPQGLYATARGTLYRIDPDDDAPWQRLTRAARRVGVDR